MDKNIILTPEIKRQHWGEGEWVNEPDFFEFSYKDYQCRIKRVYFVEGWSDEHLSLGHLCGYVRVPKDHIYHGREWDFDMDVHGGLTFFGEIDGVDGYWIGFDCAHSCDLTPSIEKFKKTNEEMKLFQEKLNKNLGTYRNHRLFNPIYRNIDYVMEQCKKIVDQLQSPNIELGL